MKQAAIPLFLVATLASTAAHAELLAGIRSSDNRLIYFDSAAPSTIVSEVAISGLAPGAVPVALDYRPNDDKLYIVSNVALAGECQLHSVDQETGAATAVGSTFSCSLPIEIDFSPDASHMRVLMRTENYRIDLASGTRTDATPAAYAEGDERAGIPVDIAGSAYDRNAAGAGATTLYAIEQSEDVLVRVGPAEGSTAGADSGQLHTIGDFGANVNGAAFDIAGAEPGTAYLFSVFELVPEDEGGTPSSEQGWLYSVSLNTAQLTALGKVGSGNVNLRGLTVIGDGTESGGSGGGGGGGDGGVDESEDSGGAFTVSAVLALLLLGLTGLTLRRRRLAARP